MTEVERLIADSFARLYPLRPVATDWDDVLVRAGAGPGRRRRLDWFMPRASLRLRIALILVLLVLLLVGIATASYFGARGWVSAGPRAAQYQSNYRLRTAFSTTGDAVGWAPGGNSVGWWTSLALSPGGRDLYAMVLPGAASTPELVHVDGINSGTELRATPVLDLANLNVPNWCVWPFVRPVSVAGNGDVFFVAGGLDVPPGASAGRSCALSGAMNDVQAFLHPAATGLGYDPTPTQSAARGELGHLLLFVLRPDRSRQLILSGSDLVRSKLFPPDWMEWRIVASAPDRVWLWVDPVVFRGPQRLFELIDPNGDGDWSDRLVRRVALPASLPFAKRRTGRSDYPPRWSWQLVAEPSLPGDDRSRSILVGVSNPRSGEFRVYRLNDRNDDGDLLDPGEAQLLLERHSAPAAQIAERVVTKDGATVRELVMAGLTRPDRVSLVSGSGAVTDIARAFGGLSTVLAGVNGELYPITGSSGNGANVHTVVYRLEPTAAVKGTVSARSASPPAAPRVFIPPSQRGEVPRLEFQRSDVNGSILASYTIGADGRDLRRFAGHLATICQSVGGQEFAYTSDAEVPTEFFTYLTTSGGTPTRVTERNDRIVCPFSSRWLLLYRPGPYRPDGSSVGSLVRHDARTGHELVVARGVDNRYALSPDGTKLVYVRRGRETLQLLDLATLQQRTLGGALRRSTSAASPYSYGIAASDPVSGQERRNAFGLRWSPDGKRVAYVVAPRLRRGLLLAPVRRRFELWVRNVSTGEPILRRAILGGRPAVAWSPDGSRLLVCVADVSFESGCPAGPGDIYGRRSWAIGAARTSARLLLVDIARGSVRRVAAGPLIFADWAPAGSLFAYATRTGLFVAPIDGRPRKLASIAVALRADPFLRDDISAWFGWSPDGRYIGLDSGCGEKSPPSIQLVDVRTGRLRAFRPFAHASYACISWWR